MTIMKRVAAAVVLVLFGVAPGYAVEIKEVVSPKGIKAWLVQDDFVPLISMRFTFKGGSSQDPDGKEGLANLMTGLFDEGAGDLTSDTFQQKLDDVGAEMGFNADDDNISGSIRMLADKRDEAVDLLALAVNAPRFDQAPIDRIRQQVIAGIKSSERDPNAIAGRKFAEALYGDHPYGRRSEGTEASLSSITHDDLKSFHKRNFGRDNLIVAVVGSISPEELAPLLDKVFGSLPEKAQLVPIAEAKLTFGQTTRVDYALPQTSISMVYPGVRRQDPDFFPAYIMNHILGGGTFSSRIYNEVREKRGLAYSAGSNLVTRDHMAALMVNTATRADRAGETLQILKTEVARMAKDGPTREELIEAKKYLVGSYAVNNLDSSSAVASTLVGLQDQKLGRDYIDKRAELINAVTLDQIKAAAKKLLETEPAILIVGPPQT
ncbi:M16 family metallopeptidase [Phyllobacterium endophyticum]|uniref:Peptidase M16 n=1 Tax=Phyllobacterium endophyticum TaxID=1149773 RepID=A0A2P7B1C4_9HYPH|nr:zinc protease [Phyllobacterium endophyticum]PSH60224.1 peptidase M16 [Phyllobacterium endophyticum]TYR42393.1 insulinase family protein [Phyllobacterium endophyticum]